MNTLSKDYPKRLYSPEGVGIRATSPEHEADLRRQGYGDICPAVRSEVPIAEQFSTLPAAQLAYQTLKKQHEEMKAEYNRSSFAVNRERDALHAENEALRDALEKMTAQRDALANVAQVTRAEAPVSPEEPPKPKAPIPGQPQPVNPPVRTAQKA